MNNKKSNNNNDSYNDFRNIYDDNAQLKKIFENYNYKFILYDTDWIVMNLTYILCLFNIIFFLIIYIMLF